MYLTQAGRYEMRGELGRGAMGVVYRGFDPNIGRTVAIKTVLLEIVEEDVLKRLRREAQAAGVLTHPNIVTIFDANQDDTIFYIAMELVEGETLQQMLERWPLPLEQVFHVVEQICAALDHAHERGIVHRDIKPANIMVTPNGQVKVMDFGVAKIKSAGITSVGEVLGTPSYMSPEAVKGKGVDGRSDIFSLGAVLYELLTGAKPFTGENVTTVIYKIIGEQPEPPAAVNPALHPGLNHVVMKALAKEREERYQTCAELVSDLKNHKELEQKTPTAVKAAAAAFASVLADGKSRGDRREADAARASATVPAGSRPRVRGSNPVLVLAAVAVLALAGGLMWQMRLAAPASSGTAEQIVVVAPVLAASDSATPPAPAPVESQSEPDGVKQPTDQPRVSGNTAPWSRQGSLVASNTAGANHRTAPTEVARANAADQGRVVLHTDPKGASILLNGKATPYRTPVNFILPVGKYRITVEQSGYTAETRDVVVRKDQVAQVRMELNPSGPWTRRWLPF